MNEARVLSSRLPAATALLALLACPPPPADEPVAETAATPPGAAASLSSWNEGASKAAIVEFVARVTDPSSPDFVPVPERVAVFDNDGTLWAERPL